MDKLRSLPLFLFLGILTAIIFEEVPRITRDIINQPNTHIWNWPIGFLFWYVLIYTIFYFTLLNKPAKYSIIYGVILGFFAETFIFKKITLALLPIMIFMVPITYGWLFYLPLKIFRSIKFKEKFKFRNILIIIGLNILTVGVLLILPRV